MSRVRSSGISKTDMEASRLVFVYVRDAKLKRKVAVPVPDGYTWPEFVQQVTNKLKISGVKEIFLASSGQKVTQLDELQDIDELCVVEGQDTSSSGAAYLNGATGSEAASRAGMVSTSEILPHGGEASSQIMSPGRHKVVIADGAGSGMSREDDERKYTKRAHPLRRMLQRLLPSIFAPGLPVSTKDIGTEDKPATDARGRRKRRRGVLTLGNAFLLIAVALCVLVMLYLFTKVTPVV